MRLLLRARGRAVVLRIPSAETLPCDTPGVRPRNSGSHTAPQNPTRGPATLQIRRRYTVGDLGSPCGVIMARELSSQGLEFSFRSP